MEGAPAAAAARQGTLIAIGGAEDKVRERLVLRRFVAAAGGEEARILVLATASALPETGDRYHALFHGLGAREVDVLAVSTREEALRDGPDAVARLEAATGLFLTGGSQLRFSSALGGTVIAAAIRRLHAGGLTVAGTSAGASLLAAHMIALGDSGGTPRRRLVQLAMGLGLAPGLIIDQHFRRRDRLGRLLTALSYNPEPLGLGVDEDTAAIVAPDGTLEVAGAGAVTVVDASAMRFTDSHAVKRGQPLAMLGLRLDFLTHGCRYDLAARTALPAGAAREPVAAGVLALR